MEAQDTGPMGQVKETLSLDNKRLNTQVPHLSLLELFSSKGQHHENDGALDLSFLYSKSFNCQWLYFNEDDGVIVFLELLQGQCLVDLFNSDLLETSWEGAYCSDESQYSDPGLTSW
jgi:hypothetical protein